MPCGGLRLSRAREARGLGPGELRLTDLEPRFLRYECRADGVHHVEVDSIAEAQGLMFLCPKCYVANGGCVGTHRIICWSRSRGVPDDAKPGPGRWDLVGTGFDDLSLLAGSSSVQLLGGCNWHGFVTGGEVT